MLKTIISFILGLLLILGAITHFFNPQVYSELIPPFVSEQLANVLAGVVELIIGIGLLLPTYRNRAGFAFMVLMILFMPIHIWDAFRSQPAMGTTNVAIIRIVIQVLLILAGWWIWKGNKKAI